MMKLLRRINEAIRNNSMLIGVVVLMLSMLSLVFYAAVQDSKNITTTEHVGVAIEKIEEKNTAELTYQPLRKQQRLSTKVGKKIVVISFGDEEYQAVVDNSTFQNVTIGEEYRVSKEEYVNSDGELLDVKVRIIN